MLAATSGARRVLEIGSFTGRTLLSLAAQLRAQAGGEAFALGLEEDLEPYTIASQILRRGGFERDEAHSGVSARVELCDAMLYLNVRVLLLCFRIQFLKFSWRNLVCNYYYMK